jgi:hypothetical protein
VNNTGATQSLFESLGQSFSPTDLATFQSQFGLPNFPVGKVIGPNDPSQVSSFIFLEILIHFSAPQTLTIVVRLT